MNRITLVGRLTSDVESRKTQNGKDVANFSIAVDRIGEGADFINCVVWNKTAEFLSTYAKKGNRVAVDGKLSTRSYENQEGKKVYVVEVVADFVDLLESKPKESTPDFNVGSRNVVNVDEDLPF